MIATIVNIHVKKECIEDFKKASALNHQSSIKEPGNLRFDVLQSKDDDTRFFLYEVYETEEAVAEHKKTSHYLQWRDTVADMMFCPRIGTSCHVIHPQDKNLW